jgi:hypothetical protein
MEFYPECVEGVVRYAAQETGVPIYVTENGIATNDDTRRIEYYRRALAGLKRAIDDGVDVRGYVTRSLLDNWEWMFGFEPNSASSLSIARRKSAPSSPAPRISATLPAAIRSDGAPRLQQHSPQNNARDGEIDDQPRHIDECCHERRRRARRVQPAPS